jgi:transcriptional regulator with XRE-family HTH domain
MKKKTKVKAKKKHSIDGFSLGERIRYLRRKRELNQVELAKIAKVSQSTIAQIESGEKDPSISALERIARALDVHISILFVGDDVHVFDLNRLRKRYDQVGKLNPTLYFALGRVVAYAKEIGFLEKS